MPWLEAERHLAKGGYVKRPHWSGLLYMRDADLMSVMAPFGFHMRVGGAVRNDSFWLYDDWVAVG